MESTACLLGTQQFRVVSSLLSTSSRDGEKMSYACWDDCWGYDSNCSTFQHNIFDRFFSQFAFLMSNRQRPAWPKPFFKSTLEWVHLWAQWLTHWRTPSWLKVCHHLECVIATIGSVVCEGIPTHWDVQSTAGNVVEGSLPPSWCNTYRTHHPCQTEGN